MNDQIRSSEGTGEDRRERMQRIRVGLTGLAVVLLIVFVATLIFQQVRPADGARAGPVAESGEGPQEPLAKLGATPAHSDDASSDNTTAPTNRTVP